MVYKLSKKLSNFFVSLKLYDNIIKTFTKFRGYLINWNLEKPLNTNFKGSKLGNFENPKTRIVFDGKCLKWKLLILC